LLTSVTGDSEKQEIDFVEFKKILKGLIN